MKRICFVIPEVSDGGAEKVMLSLAAMFCDADFDVYLLLTKSGREDYEVDKRIHKVISFKNDPINQIIFIRKWLRSLKPSHVISFFTFQNVYTLIAAIGLRTRVIVSERNDPSKTCYGHRIMHFLRWFFYSTKAFKLVVQTDEAKRYFTKTIQKKTRVIINPLNSDQMGKWSGIDSREFVAMSRLNQQKNIPLMIRSFVIFHQSHPDYYLSIFGDGQLRDEIERLIISLDASPYIRLCGRVERVSDFYCRSFAFISSSNYEGLSNSMLEAMSCGQPVICTDCPIGGARMMIQDGKNGFLTETGNVERLAEKMGYIVSNKEKMLGISEEAMKIRELTRPSTIFNEWLTIMEG